MARQRCIQFLLIVCSLLFLATTVTPFRLRDLASKTSAEKQVSSRRNPLLDKCEGCESESDHQKYSSVSALKVKEIASRRTYEDVKKAVKEKQKILNDKKIQHQYHQKPTSFHEDSDDDDDDDDDDEFDIKTVSQAKLATKKRIQNSQMNAQDKENVAIKKNTTKHNSVSDDSEEDDEDNDDDSDEDGEEINDENNDSDDNSDIVDNDDDSENDDDHSQNSEDGNADDDSDNYVIETKLPILKFDKDRQGQQLKTFPKEIKSTIMNNMDKQAKIKNAAVLTMPDRDSDDEDDDSDDDDDSDNNEYKKPTLNVLKIESPRKNVEEPQKIEKHGKPKNILDIPILEKKQTTLPSKESKPFHSKANDTLQEKNVKENIQVSSKDKETTKHDQKKEQKPQPDHMNVKKNEKNHKLYESKTTISIPQVEKPKPPLEKEFKIEMDEQLPPTKTKEVSKESKQKESAEKIFSDHKNGQTKEKANLKHASDALYRKNFLQSEFEDFYAFLPSFAPNFSRIHNPECRRHGQILLRQLRGSKLWALNMLDASGKISSGVLQGNANQLGNFAQCVASRARVRLDSGHVVRVRGRYCLATLELRADAAELRLPVHLAQARNLMKSKIDDPGHFIPRFSSLNWGVCLPAACSADDAEFVMRDALRHYQLAGLHLRVHVDPLNCHTENEEPWDAWLELPTLLTISFFAIILLLVIYSTLNDFLSSWYSDTDEISADEVNSEDATADDNKLNRKTEVATGSGPLSAFSLRRNWPRLLRAGDAEDIACIHGVRALCSLALLFAHKIIPIANMPFVNRVRLTEVSHTPLSYALRLGWVYTDAFLLLSGALTAHRLSADLDAGSMPWLRRFVTRYVRLTPALLGVVLFYAYVWEQVGAGPLWGTLVSQNAKLCRDSWWLNLLYVQNFFSFDQMCAPQTYQLAVDMQLTLGAAALVWLLRARPGTAAALLVALQAAGAYARYSATLDHRLSLLIYHGVSASQLYRTARLSYASAMHRSTPYLAGLALGVLLQRRPTTSLSKLVTVPCWLVCGCCCAGVAHAALGAAAADARYSAAAAAAYAGLAPPAAAAALVWLLYAAHSGNAQWINSLLCAWPLVLVSRLSYALYLVQFLVFFTNAATVTTATEFTLFSILDIREFATIFALSTLLTLTLVIPMQTLSKYVLSYELSFKEEIAQDPQENEPEVMSHEAVTTENQFPRGEERIEEVQKIHGSRIMAHREFLEEIMEAEIEYESQRDMRDEGLEEILEEEEDDLLEEEVGEEDLELVEGEEPEGGEDDFWAQRNEEWAPRRTSRFVDQDDEWEWTSNEPDPGGVSEQRYNR